MILRNLSSEWPVFLNITIVCTTVFIIISLSGCQTASFAVDSAQAIRGQIAKKELEIHVNGLCGSNFKAIRDRFGKSDQQWNSILTICESGQNSVKRNSQ